MEKKLVIIDNFFDNPQEIRDFALAQEYVSYKGETYPGKNSTTAFFPEEMRMKISVALGEEIVAAPNTANGLFRLSPENSTHLQDIHIDPVSHWAGVLFLNLPHQCKGGTYFWKHLKHGFEQCPLSQEEGEMYGFSSYEEIRSQIIEGDGLDRSKWELLIKANMRFNRLVLFRPYLWHSHGENFGVTKFDARLVQLFFLNSTGQIVMPATQKVQEPEQITHVPLKDELADNLLQSKIEEFYEHRRIVSSHVPQGTLESPLSPKYFYEQD